MTPSCLSPPAPAVSVIIPSYRGGTYLREAVASVLGQSFQDFELVIVASCREEDLVDLGSDERISVLRQARRGVAIARNVGLRASRSELVAFLDDDDRMLPDRLAAQVETMGRRPEVGLCHTQFRLIDALGAPGHLGFAADVQYPDLLRREIRILMPTTMMRRSLLEELGGFDPVQRGEDLDVIYRVARETVLAFVPEVQTEYRRHDSNGSGDSYLEERDVILLLQKHRRLAQLEGDAERAAAAAYGLAQARQGGAIAAIEACRASRRQRDTPGSVRHLFEAFAMSPRYTLTDLAANRRPVRMLRGSLASLRPGSSS